MGANLTLTGNTSTVTTVTAQQTLAGNIAAVTKKQSVATVDGVNSNGPSPATPYVVDWSVIVNKPTFGTAASRDVPAVGDAGVAQVVLGTDSRLSGARPTTVAQITDAQTTGKNVLLAPSQGAARLALGVSAFGDSLVTSIDAPTTRSTLGLGTMAIQPANNVVVTGGSASGLAITGGTVSGLATALAVVDGGTGAVNATAARTNLGSGSIGDSLFLTTTAQAARDILVVASVPVFQCRLDMISTTIIRMSRRFGPYIWINGAYRQIPVAGVDLAPTSLTVQSTYNIYAFWTGTAVQTEASLTARAIDTNYGHPIKSGDPSRTFIGKAYVQSGPSWDNTAGGILTISYWNRMRRSAYSVLGATTAVSNNTTPVAFLNGGYALSFAEDTAQLSCSASQQQFSGGSVNFTQATHADSTGFAVAGPGGGYWQAANPSSYGNVQSIFNASPAESLGASTSGTAYFQCSMRVWCNGGTFQVLAGSDLTATIMG